MLKYPARGKMGRDRAIRPLERLPDKVSSSGSRLAVPPFSLNSNRGGVKHQPAFTSLNLREDIPLPIFLFPKTFKEV